MMRESTGYIYSYEICAVFFLAVVMLRYFRTTRFPNRKNMIFSAILVLTASDMVFDLISAYIIDHVERFPLVITYLVNEVFYSLQIGLLMMMALYALSLTEYMNMKMVLRHLPILIPGNLTILMILINPLTHGFFYVDPVKGYEHGDAFILIYLMYAFYTVTTFVIAHKNRKKIGREDYNTICRFIVITSVAVMIQFSYPRLLISGVAIALAVIMIYFTMQNPDAMIDSKTGAFTYDAMISVMGDIANERSHIQLIAVNINNMHRINEILGVKNGNRLLREIREYLQRTTENSWIFRMSGNCFVSITQKAMDTQELGKKIEKNLSRPWLIGTTEISVQATLCCVNTRGLLDEPLSPEAALNYLDTAFLQNERIGKRQKIITLGSELLGQIKRSKEVEDELRRTIEDQDGMEVYFQPIWSVKEQRFTSVEALLRFNHPTMGSIPPSEFVPIAESSGIVMALDEFVLRKVCEFIRENDLRGRLGINAVQINLSAIEFMQRRIPKLLESILEEYEVDPKLLIFEVTETAATESYELVNECMTEIKKFGCRFALDDFGMGYANISQVIQLPFSVVKLDQSLINGSEIVLADLTRMFARMDHLTVVEGVEDARQAELVKNIGADYIQGFYYAYPMCAEKLVDFLGDNAETAAKKQ